MGTATPSFDHWQEVKRAGALFNRKERVYGKGAANQQDENLDRGGLIMANSVYVINKGINKSIEFKGLKAQYIWYLGGGMMGLIILFSLMYVLGVNQYLCLGIILPAGGLTLFQIYRLSNTYGEHGMMKMMARRSVPKLVRSNSRMVYLNLKKNDTHGK
jgi:hypothetical protein